MQQVKEHVLHCDIKPNDRVFYFTTCGWMMWNWLVAALAARLRCCFMTAHPLFHFQVACLTTRVSRNVRFLGRLPSGLMLFARGCALVILMISQACGSSRQPIAACARRPLTTSIKSIKKMYAQLASVSGERILFRALSWAIPLGLYAKAKSWGVDWG